MHKKRYLSEIIRKNLVKKMVFIGGPRQVGKTTLALDCLNEKATEQHPAYLNWDYPPSAAKIRNLELPVSEKILILDEIHKYVRWRNLIKGIYDTQKSRHQFIITGSARLDYYRRGGDSLLGRYRYLRLHPFSLTELNPQPTTEDLQMLLHFGGFPEPLFSQKDSELRIWQRERIHRVIREDLRDLERVQEISLIELLVDMLPSRVGSVLSVNSLREDLQVDHKTVERWLTILENLYVCFRIPPFGSPKIRAVKKEKKLYLWDWSPLENEGAKFENLVASHLLKYCHFLEDTEGYTMDLRFIRDKDKREIDFVVIQNKKPLFAVECKTGESQISPSIHYFKERTSIPMFYQIHRGTKDFQKENIRVLPYIKFVKEFNLP